MAIMHFEFDSRYIPYFFAGETYQSAKISDEGMQIIIDYYAKKYLTCIMLGDPDEQKNREKIVKFKKLIEENQNKDKDFRACFIINYQGHVVPFFYIKEKDKEVFLILDTIPHLILTTNKIKEIFGDGFFSTIGIPILETTDARQSSVYGCRTDALVMARDITAKDAAGHYPKVENLLVKLTEGKEISVNLKKQ